jgi:hypothetical protein
MSLPITFVYPRTPAYRAPGQPIPITQGPKPAAHTERLDLLDQLDQLESLECGRCIHAAREGALRVHVFVRREAKV